MEHALEITNVLSDPTRFHIYQHIVHYPNGVTVLDVANKFSIHPNVARIHLSKLEAIRLVTSSIKKTGKGGRPSRIYKLSEETVELHFPYRDYKLLSMIALDSFMELGEVGRKALFHTGKKYGTKIMEQNINKQRNIDLRSIERKLSILKDAFTMLGMYPRLNYSEAKKQISFRFNNCPFKEIASTNEENQQMICQMHYAFLYGMFEALFSDFTLVEEGNIFENCSNCTYRVAF